MSERLEDIARAITAEGKGILAADESTGTIKKRFETIGAESTPVLRRDYREMLFSASGAMRDYISGVILYDETLQQTASDGRSMAELISASGAVPGIKVDQGAKDMAFHPGEKVTEGLDGLRERLKAYHGMGARFAKWRGVIDIADDIPTLACIKANAHALARYAALCQEQAIVPIVEPEVLMDGPVASHDIDRCYAVTERVLNIVFEELAEAKVQLEGMVLKPNMVIAGKNAKTQASPEEVAEKTLRCLKATVPAAVPGIAFLSGGQSDEDATKHLSLMNEMGPHPWRLTFSYGRALQAAALKAWGGRASNVKAAQAAFAHRARMNGLAARGEWNASLEKAA
jgi:fructose-bisphosphate aldolase, class I